MFGPNELASTGSRSKYAIRVRASLGNGTFHYVLADYYKRELAGESERPEKLLRNCCMVLHGYDQRGDAFVYKDCIWPLLTDLLHGLKRAVEEDDDYAAW